MRLLIALLVLCTASISSAGMQSPRNFVKAPSGASEFCSGTEIFCTSWETGSDELNTGASGNEDTFDSKTGSPIRIAYGWEGSYGLSSTANNYYVSKDFGSQTDITITAYFEVDSDSITSGFAQIIQVRDLTDSNPRLNINIAEDAAAYDTTMLFRVVANNGAALVNIGSDYAITQDTRYKCVVHFGQTDDTISWSLYDADGNELSNGSGSTTYNSGLRYLRVGTVANQVFNKVGAIKIE